jgi:hypothetical protein
VAFFLAFALSMVANGLSTSGIVVPIGTKEISDAHPVYLTPGSYAFSVWGIIYVLLGLVAIIQLLPSSTRDPFFEPIRPLGVLTFLCNGGWLFLFAYEYFWIAFVVITLYCAALYRIVTRIDLNVVVGLASLRRTPGMWKQLLTHASFAANASWLTVATLLQLEVTLLEEGWMPSEGFSTGLIAIATLVACGQAYNRADILWSAVAAWALLAIGANQLPESRWGCLDQICTACEIADTQRICTSGRDAPLGWKAACAAYEATAKGSEASCALERSETILHTAVAGTAAVALCLLLGLLRGSLMARALGDGAGQQLAAGGRDDEAAMTDRTSQSETDSERAAPSPSGAKLDATTAAV